MENEVSKWLKEINCEEYDKIFYESGFRDLKIISKITEKDLEEMGIKLGFKKIILKHSKKLKTDFVEKIEKYFFSDKIEHIRIGVSQEKDGFHYCARYMKYTSNYAILKEYEKGEFKWFKGKSIAIDNWGSRYRHPWVFTNSITLEISHSNMNNKLYIKEFVEKIKRSDHITAENEKNIVIINNKYPKESCLWINIHINNLGFDFRVIKLKK